MLRAAWMQQELLVTFENEIGEIALSPSEVSGDFTITLEDKVISSRAIEGKFPDLKELKNQVRDLIAPNKSLGHSER